MNNPQVLLGLSPTASQEEIKAAYYKKVREFPPDRYPEEFKEIRSAYEKLKKGKEKQENQGGLQSLKIEESDLPNTLEVIQEMKKSYDQLSIKDLIKLTF